MSTRTDSPTYSVRTGWRSLAIAGGVVALLGVLAAAFPVITSVSMVYGLGALFVVAAVVHAAHAITARGWRGSTWQVALAVVTALAGALLLANPILGLATLTLLVVAYLLVDGAAELWTAIRMGETSGRAWIGASGVVSLALAALLWIGFPADAAWAIGLLAGASLFATGVSMVAVAYAGRSADEDVPAAGEPRGA